MRTEHPRWAPQHFRLIPEVPCHTAKSIVLDSFNFTLAKAGIMCRSHDRSRSKLFAQDDAGRLVAKRGGSSGLLALSLCVSPRTLSPFPHPKAYETAWFEDLSFCTGSRGELEID